jgi:hypothetical protein
MDTVSATIGLSSGECRLKGFEREDLNESFSLSDRASRRFERNVRDCPPLPTGRVKPI